MVIIMSTIIYTTNAGSSEKYANMLGEKTGYSVVSLAKSGSVSADEEIIYIGWVMAGTLQGYADAIKKFSNIKAVCAVGMSSDDKDKSELQMKNNITQPLFLLAGSFSISKLKGMYKLMMNMAVKAMQSKIKDASDDEKKALDMFVNGFDFVSEDNLTPIIEFLNS